MMKRFPLLTLSAVLGALTGCALFTPPLSPELAALKLPYRIEDGALTITNADRAFTIRGGSRVATFNGTTVYLLREAELSGDGTFSVDPASIDKVIEPLLFGSAPAADVKTILLDPGHGGGELGAVGPAGTREKEINLSLAHALRAELEKRGFKVLMTRDDDREVGLDERGSLCNRLQPDLFLSIHHNAAGNRNATGIETYALTPAGSPSTSDTPTVRVKEQSLRGNRFDAQNVTLAAGVQTYLRRRVGGPDRGVKFARFRVLVLAACPAILIEAGFLSNPAEEKNIASPQRQAKAAAAIADAVTEYARHRLRRSGASESPTQSAPAPSR